MTRHSDRLEEAARILGVDLMPWQKAIGEAMLSGERIIVNRGRRGGWSTLARVVNQAQSDG